MFANAKKLLRVLTETERNVVMTATVLFCLAGVILLIASLSSAVHTVPASGGSYVQGVVGQPSFVNPVMAKDDADKILVRLMFSHVKELAEKIEKSGDGRAWNIRLKDNLFWHDGEKLTADDVIFTVHSIQNPDSRSPLGASWRGLFLERVSERELRITLGVPYAFFEDNYLSNLYVLPRHLFKDIPLAICRLSELNLRTVGSGTFMFHSYQQETNGFIPSYTMSANPTYGGERPFLDTFKVKFFSGESGREALFHAFNKGQIDGFGGAELNDDDLLKRPHTLTRFPLANYYAVFINESQHPALKEKVVREAMNLVIDRVRLGKEIFNEQGEIATSPVPRVLQSELRHVPQPVPSFEEARRVLEEAGWHVNYDGVREKRIENASATLAFTLTTPKTTFLFETAEWLQNAWKGLGIFVELRTLENATALEETLKNREYELLLFGNVLSSRFDLTSFWHSSERFYPGLNLSLYRNKKVDELLEAITQSNDPAIAEEKLVEVASRIADDVPALFLYSPDYLYISVNDLRGITTPLLSEESDHIRGAADWYVRTRWIFRQ